MKPDPERPGQLLEPIEEVSIFVHENYAGQVVQKLTMRKGMGFSSSPLLHCYEIADADELSL
jgi:predicted membrane GTPase involved in stress response